LNFLYEKQKVKMDDIDTMAGSMDLFKWK